MFQNYFLKGFKGKTCNTNINDCAVHPCGQGSCIDGINNFTCNCTGSGYTGPTCSEDIDECKTNNPCHPNATCINHLGTYQCDCQPGFTGKNCYENIDDCRSNPCQHGGMSIKSWPNKLTPLSVLENRQQHRKAPLNSILMNGQKFRILSTDLNRSLNCLCRRYMHVHLQWNEQYCGKVRVLIKFWTE